MSSVRVPLDHPRWLDSSDPIVHLVRVSGAGPALVASMLGLGTGPRAASVPKVVLVCADHDSCEASADDLRALNPSAKVLTLPHPETSPYDPIRPDRAQMLSRAAALTLLDQGQWDYLVCSASAWMRRVISPESVGAHTEQLTVGAPTDLERLSQRLSASGYQRMPLTEDPGTLSVRGDIFDVWPPTQPYPVRVELEFERVVRMTQYEPETQRTLSGDASLTSLLLGPAKEFLMSDQDAARVGQVVRQLCDEASWPSSQSRALIEELQAGQVFMGAAAFLPAFGPLSGLYERLPAPTTVVFDDAGRAQEALEAEWEQAQAFFDMRADQPHFPPSAHFLNEADLDRSIQGFRVFALHRQALSGPAGTGFRALATPPLDALSLETEPQDQLSATLSQTRKALGKDAGLGPLLDRVSAWNELSYRVVLSARNEAQRSRLSTLLAHRGAQVIPSDTIEWTAPLRAARTPSSEAPHLELCVSPLCRGVVAPHQALVLLTEEEIFGRRKHTVSRRAARAVKNALDDLRSLSPGDFVVHIEHGIGRYAGLEHRVVAGIAVDLLAVEYAGGDRLLLPVYRLYQNEKFSGESAPKMDRLGGVTFAKTKSRAKKRVRILADQLLRLYAERRAVERAPIAVPDDSFASFEAGFPYEETSDQAAAIADVVSDLRRDQVMDRLVCGDVGFGKTEVALRAAFLVAQEGRQVALLCPTTVLAEQHLRTVQARFADTGLVVASLSRFVPKKKQGQVLADLKAGRIDIVVGTHRLLSKDVHFKNLGLLVIDEEQRFGVAHKERILELRRAVDVLTLSATPIPRTLSMAIGGMRDMSVINTPPMERRAIRTFTSRFDEQLVRDAVRRELERGGQVFYVYNRVEGIYERAALLKRLLPDVRVAVGHGQLSERELEKTMYGFVNGEFDVLCATAIVESGLDIPRANTIIIDRADLFGLSQLYQLRGRVGRSSERGYCYLLVPSDERLSSEARARIETLERYSELGSGFHVATMDMELRGAGELLGADQSGFMERIGFDLFSRMLEEATAELRGESYLAEIDPELSLDVEALLPETYIEDIGVRLSLYKRLASAETPDEVAGLSDEIADRFGAPPREALRYFEVMSLKTELRRLRALSLHATKKTATLVLAHTTPLTTDSLVQLVLARPGEYQLSPDGRLKHTEGPTDRFGEGLSHANHLVRELLPLLR